MPHWLAIDGVQPDIPENRATTIKRQKRTDDMHNNPAEKKSESKYCAMPKWFVLEVLVWVECKR